MALISTHVLDVLRGRPAAGLRVTLLRLTDSSGEPGAVSARLSSRRTDDDGRVPDMLNDAVELENGNYTLRFALGEYFAEQGVQCFFPHADTSFTVLDPVATHHLPLLISPFSYTTYRGS